MISILLFAITDLLEIFGVLLLFPFSDGYSVIAMSRKIIPEAQSVISLFLIFAVDIVCRNDRITRNVDKFIVFDPDVAVITSYDRRMGSDATLYILNVQFVIAILRFGVSSYRP